VNWAGESHPSLTCLSTAWTLVSGLSPLRTTTWSWTTHIGRLMLVTVVILTQWVQGDLVPWSHRLNLKSSTFKASKPNIPQTTARVVTPPTLSALALTERQRTINWTSSSTSTGRKMNDALRRYSTCRRSCTLHRLNSRWRRKRRISWGWDNHTIAISITQPNIPSQVP
jgi:hypothetical protein